MIPIKINDEKIINNYVFDIEQFIKTRDKVDKRKVSDLIDEKLEEFCDYYQINKISFSNLITLQFDEMEKLKQLIDNDYNEEFFGKKDKNDKFNFYKFIYYYEYFFYKYDLEKCKNKDISKNFNNYGLKYIENLGVDVCPYCNVSYTFATQTRRLGEFDHFFSKEKYPIFALSFYNLVPVCPNCNHKKREKDLKLINPYSSNLKYDTFKFFPKPKKQIGKFNILLTNPKGDERQRQALDALTNENGLDLEKVYEHISYIADELYEKAIFYNECQLLSIKSLKTKDTRLFYALIDAQRLILMDTSYSEKDYLKRSCSKIIKDIADEFGISQLSNFNI